jgi:hypothetical protein
MFINGDVSNILYKTNIYIYIYIYIYKLIKYDSYDVKCELREVGPLGIKGTSWHVAQL